MHIIKLCVGVATLEELEGYRSERAHWWGADYGEHVHVHRTRTMPKRPFQGWRYLTAKDAPRDKGGRGFAEEGAPEIADELMRLGLL